VLKDGVKDKVIPEPVYIISIKFTPLLNSFYCLLITQDSQPVIRPSLTISLIASILLSTAPFAI
jgi:hypothetical protein